MDGYSSFVMHSNSSFGRIVRFLCVVIFVASNAIHVAAQTGYGHIYGMDPSFTTALETTGGSIYASVPTSDGGFIVGGSFSTIAGQQHLGLAKLKPDGTVDPTFNFNKGCDGTVMSIVIQNDGRIVVGGIFNAFDGMVCGGVARLNADGTLDHSFSPGVGFSSNFSNGTIFAAPGFSDVYSVAVQADGRIIVGGSFTLFNGTACGNIARLNTDGTLDTSFNTGAGFSSSLGSSINAMAVESNGQIVVGGFFDTYSGVSRYAVARLNGDGTLDTSFAPTLSDGLDAVTANTVLVQPDGHILVGGYSTFYSLFQETALLLRLNPDGTRDNSFSTGNGFATNSHYSSINALALQPDGQIVVSGAFSGYNGIASSCIVRLRANGMLDANFNSGSGFAENAQFLEDFAEVDSISLLKDGSIAATGLFTAYNGTSATNLVHLTAGGLLDPSLSAGACALPSSARAFPLPNGKFMVCGNFTSVNGTACAGIARLNADGTLDTGFNTRTGFSPLYYNGPINAIAVQSDGKIVVGGSFSSYNGAACSNIARLNADGTLDTSFNEGAGFSFGQIESIVIQADGRIVAGGPENSYNGVPCHDIVRLNADGSMDTSFNHSSGFVFGNVYSLALQADGRIVAVGDITMVQGPPWKDIARLNPDGTPDTSFNPGTGFGDGPNVYFTVALLALQANGKIVAAGGFTTFNGNPCAGIVRLNADGTSDTTFNPGTGFDVRISALTVQADGKIVVGGTFSKFNGTPCNRVARLNPDGSLDPVFGALNLMWANNVSGVSFLSDGRLLVSGAGAASNGLLQVGLGLFMPDVASVFTTQPQSATTNAGDSVIFTAIAGGTPAPTYQWYKGATLLAGQTGTSLTLNRVQPTDAGSYTVVATNPAGSATSNAATLTVTTSSSSGGGGGALSGWFFATLLAAAAFRYGQRHRRLKMRS